MLKYVKEILMASNKLPIIKYHFSIPKGIEGITKEITNLYPCFEKWFKETITEESLTSNERCMLVAYLDKQVVGLTILKNKEGVKKISTFFVDEKYRRASIGTLLFNEACTVLGTDKPSITWAGDECPSVTSFLANYDIHKVREEVGLYKEDVLYYIFE